MAAGAPTPRPLRDSAERPWGFFALIGAIVLAAGALLVGPGLLSPQATPHPTVEPSSDPHTVVAPEGTFTIAYADGAVVVSRLDGAVSTELGRAPVPEALQPAFSGDPIGGASAWTMTCPGRLAAEPTRFLFGSIFPAGNSHYVGPRADGAFAPDGLFLYVLAPGPVDPGAFIRVESAGGSAGVDAATFDRTLNSGASQASGCHVE